MPKPKILVLGATGFIGGHIARALTQSGYPVRAAKRAASPTWHLEDLELEWVQVELDEPNTLRAALDGCAGLVHAAGFYPQDGLDVDGARRRALLQQRCVLDACLDRDLARVVFVSSPATLGGVGHEEGPLDETSFYVPGTVRDAYFESKFTMEAEIYRYVRQGLAAVIVIPTAVFGPGDVKPSSGQWLVRLAQGRLPAVVGRQLNVVDARDVATSTVAALERGRPGRRYILGGTNTEVEALAGRVAEIAGVDPPRFHLPSAPVRTAARWAERVGRRVGLDVPAWVVGVDLASFAHHVSDARARAELGHRSRQLDQTLADALSWFDTHGYLDKGLGE